MKTKTTLPFILAGLLVVGTACSATPATEPLKEGEKNDALLSTNKASIPTEVEYVDNSKLVMTVDYDDFAELEKNADLIVIAQATKPFEERHHEEIYQDIPEDQSKILIDGFTETEILIKKVLKQPELENKAAGDTMTVQEPAFAVEEDGVKTIRTINNYRAINETDDYILFFNKSGWNDGSYTSMNWNNGKFSLQQPNELKEALAKSRNLDTEIIEEQVKKHKEMENVVFEKYAEEINKILQQ